MKSSKSKSSVVVFFKVSTLVLSFFFFLSLTVDRPLLTITGACLDNTKPLEGVDVSIMVDGGVLTHNITGPDGKYKLTVNFGKLVKLAYEKKGYLTQTVKLRTVLNGLPETEMTTNYNLDMLALPSDTSQIYFDKSVDEILFDNDLHKFVSNADYKERVKEDFDAVKKLIVDARMASK